MIVENGILLKVEHEDIIDGKVEIPESVKSIGDDAFSPFISLEEINIPYGVTSIGQRAFFNCNRLTKITIPDSVTIIGAGAFSNCTSLTKINIPNSVTSIGSRAFCSCTRLKEINIPNNLTNINKETFTQCKALTEIKIPSSVKKIGESAFCNCKSLNKVEIPNSVTEIEKYAFERCINLTDVSIPDSVTRIGASAFSSCNNLSKINILNTVKSIGEKAFYECENLIEIDISEMIKVIGDNAFTGCDRLKRIKFENNSIEVPEKYIDIVLNKYGLIIISQNGINTFLKSQQYLVNEGYIDANLDQSHKNKQEETLKSQVEQIFNNKNFKVIKEGNKSKAIIYLNKIINVLGVNETLNLLKIPEGISESDIKKCGEKLLEVYEAKYKLNGNIPIVITMIDNIDTMISQKSKDVRNDRNKFYTKLNELLENRDIELSIERVLESCFEEIGIKLSDAQIEKIKRELQTMQIREKSDEIRSKIREKINNPETNIMQAGVSSTLIYKVIKQNILNGGSEENIEKILDAEINKTRNDGTRYYGENIINQKEKLKKIIKQIYRENSELLNCNMVEILRDIKDKIGNRWILKLKNSRNNIRNLHNMTEAEKNQLIANMEKNYINEGLIFVKQYELKPGISSDEAIKILSEGDFPELLTYEKAEMMFSGIKEPLSEKFGVWFAENRSEIMRNPEYYISLSKLHNEFRYMLQDSITNAMFENKALTPEIAFNILSSMEKERKTRK